MKYLIMIAAVGFALGAAEANADSLFYDNCVSQGQSQKRADNMVEFSEDAMLFIVADRSGFMGMSCQDLKNVFDGVNTVNAVLAPAVMVLNRTPGLSASLGAELAELGLTFSNPVVLTVAVGGAIGYSVVYVVMKQSMRDCEAKQQLIIEQLKLKFDLPQNTKVNLQIEGGV